MSPTLRCVCLGLASLALAFGAVREIPPDTLPHPLPTESPLGLPAAPFAPHPLEERGLVELGRRLFFSPVLSRDRSIACASCHDPAHGFADPRPRSIGVAGRRTKRHAPTLFNRALGASFLWDGRAATLEEQVLLPIQDELEMDLPVPEAVARLARDAAFARTFAKVFEGAPSEERLAVALAAFVRKLSYGDSRVDRFRRGDRAALSEAERSGMWFFESRGGCWRCHSGPNFSDEDFHNTGIGLAPGAAPTEVEPGRFAVTGLARDRGAFKTPTLRGLAETAPYMHDGSLATLEEVVRFYREGGRSNAYLDARVRPLEMTDTDAAHLAAFLRALSRP